MDKNGSFKSWLADGLLGAFSKHLPMKLRASSSSILWNDPGSFPYCSEKHMIRAVLNILNEKDWDIIKIGTLTLSKFSAS